MNTIQSKDGTSIAYRKTGNGPAVILVDGAFCSKDFGPMPKLAPLLAKHFTVFTYDRRARGDSGDTAPYTVAREIEDIEVLISKAGGSAHLYGVSSGAVLCIRAAVKRLNINKLVLFEPPFFDSDKQKQLPADPEGQLTQFIRAGRKKDAVTFYLRKIMGAPAIIPLLLRLTPNWAKMVANANSLPYDAAIMGDFSMDKNAVASIPQPALIIDSEKSPGFLRQSAQTVATTLPNGKRKSLKGTFHDVPAKLLVPTLVDFYNH